MKGIFCIALNTYRELVRGKILFSIFFFAVAIVIITTLFASVSIGDQVKIIKDFGLFASSLFTVSFAVISGSALLFKELNKKTIFNILSKPISRSEFILGKYLGMLLTSLVMLSFMAITLIVLIACFEGLKSFEILYAFYAIALQLVVICASAIFFSTVVITPLLSGAFTFSLFIAGRLSEFLLSMANTAEENPGFRMLAKGFYYIIPHLDLIDLSSKIVYEVNVEHRLLIWSTIYCFSYAAILLSISIIIFKKREFK